jgi:hypothetical protein
MKCRGFCEDGGPVHVGQLHVCMPNNGTRSVNVVNDVFAGFDLIIDDGAGAGLGFCRR